MDGTVRISQMGNGQTPDGDPIFKADLSVVPGKDAEGILAMLGNDELVNSKYAKFVVMTPAGDASYRYTYNKTAGNIPLGIKKGLALVSNNNAWADPGASDPNKVQGDLLAEADGIITIQYSGQAYNETSTINEANFWAAKVAPDGSLTEVPNSRYSTTIEANRKIAKNIQSKSISFPIQQGESVRFLANSNIDDGFYLQSGTDGKPLFEVIINFKEMVGMPFIPDELEKGATEFYE